MNFKQILHKFDNQQVKESIDSQHDDTMRIGSIVEMAIQIQEGEKCRLQKYKGILMARKNKCMATNLRVRKIFQKIGVEKIVPINSPQLQSVSVIKHYEMRRSKIYYLRKLKGKASPIKD